MIRQNLSVSTFTITPLSSHMLCFDFYVLCPLAAAAVVYAPVRTDDVPARTGVIRDKTNALSHCLSPLIQAR